MVQFIVGVVVGIVIGGLLGISLMCITFVGKQADEKIDKK